MCGTCGRYQFLSGKIQSRHMFVADFPLFFSVLVTMSFVFSVLHLTVPNGPNLGESTVAAMIVLVLVLFFGPNAINDRLEVIVATAPAKGKPVESV
jgi:hypothetical protein